MLKRRLNRLSNAKCDEQIQTVIPQMSDVQSGLQAVMSGVIAQGAQTTQVAQTWSHHLQMVRFYSTTEID